MQRPWVVILFLCLSITSLIVAFTLPIRAKPVPQQFNQDSQPDQYHDAPFFMLTERHGGDVTTADFDGKVWIASFVFTRCTKGCPQVTATMVRLQDELKLKENDQLRFVTFTVDPERDTLDDLKKYAKQYQADETRWLFLTGKEKLVRPLLIRGFKIAAHKREIPQPGDEFDHSTKLFVMDRHGKIRGTFDGMQGEHDEDGSRYQQSLANLKQLVTLLLEEK